MCPPPTYQPSVAPENTECDAPENKIQALYLCLKNTNAASIC